MATVSAAQLIQRTRRLLRDWPDRDNISASVSSTDTNLTVADSSWYGVNWPLEIDNETMIVRSLPDSTTVTVERGAFGSTAASHSSGASVLVRPAYFTVEILDAINAGIQACYPRIYKAVLDTSLTIEANTYEYDMPNMPGTYNGDTITIPRLHTVEIQIDGQVPYYELGAWSKKDGEAPILKLTYLEPPGATLRLKGYGPFPDLTDESDSLDDQWPRNFTYPLAEYAASQLLMSAEAARSRADVGARDDREAANKPGAALALGTQLEARFLRRLSLCAMPPWQPHIVFHE